VVNVHCSLGHDSRVGAYGVISPFVAVLAATARALATPTWLVAGVGRRVPEPYWQTIVERVAEPDQPSWLAPFEVVSMGLLDRILTADGLALPAEAAPSEVPVASELLQEAR